LSESFLEEKFQVATVDNGLNVAEAVKDFGPHIILLDLILPGLDGFAVLKALKSNPKTEKIPVVVLSNLSDVGDVKSTKALGADEYFIKSNTEMSKIVKYVKNKLKV
jgi:DNA-binding response OmpR family regulator